MDKYKFTGKVEKGAGYGRKIGYPTINIFVPKQELPKAGVYSGSVTLEDKNYLAGIVVGPGEKVEAHLLGYEGDAYGREAVIEISKFIRDFKKFDTEEELIAHIENDLKML